MKSKLLMFIATLIASVSTLVVQAQMTVIPYLPVKVEFGGTSVADLTAFLPPVGDYTLEVDGTEGIEINIAGGVYTYTPEATGKIRFSQKNGKVYVYEGDVYKTTLVPTDQTVFPAITDADVATNSAQLLSNCSFETTGNSVADGKFEFGAPWETNVTVAAMGIRIGTVPKAVNGSNVVVWRGSGNSNYFAQPLLANLKPNTSYKIQAKQVDGGNAYATFNVGLGSTANGMEYGKKSLILGNLKNNTAEIPTWDAVIMTPSTVADASYFTFSNTISNTSSAGSDPVVQMDYISLVEGVSPTGITGVTNATYLVGAAYAPAVMIDFSNGDYYDMTTYCVANPDAIDGNNGWTITGSMNAPKTNESWLGADAANPYFDGGNWGGTGWTAALSQTINGLPAGKYTLKAVARASDQVTMTLALKAGASSKSVVCPSVNATGGSIWEAAEEGSVEKLVNAGKGFGWANNSVQVDLLAGEPLTISFNSTTTGIHQWFSADQFRLSYVGVAQNVAPVAPVTPVPTTTVKPVVTGEYVIYHPDSKKYLSNNSAANAPVLNDYGYISGHDAYTWTVTVSGDANDHITMKQLSSSNYVNASTANAWGMELGKENVAVSLWAIKDVEKGYNLASLSSKAIAGRVVGMDGLTGNDLGIYYDKTPADKHPLFQFVNKEDFFASADVIAYDAYKTKLAVYNAKKDLMDAISRANALVESHPAAYAPEATVAYEAVLSAAREVYLNEEATLDEVKSEISSIPTALNIYLMSVITASEENPVDISFLITNPDFNANNATGWTGATGAANNMVYEVYSKNFNMYQKLAGLPAGYYELKANGFARAAGNDAGAAYKAGTEKVQSFLYANAGSENFKAPFMSLYAEDATGTLNGYANSMAEANTAFQAGKYANNVVGNIFLQENTNDTLTIGATYEGTLIANSWTIFDNFTLIYKGNTTGSLVKEVKELLVSAEAVTGVMQIATATALADEITAAKALVDSEGPTKEALIEAREKLTAAMAAANASKAAYVKLSVAIVAAGESVVATEAEVVASIATAQGVYDAQAVDEAGIDAAIVALKTAINATILAKAQNGDVTAMIVNPMIVQTALSQVPPKGWENSTNAGTNGNFTKAVATAAIPSVDTFLEAWGSDASKVAFDYNQTIQGVPNGVYELGAATFTESNNGNSVLYANEATTSLKTGVNGGNFKQDSVNTKLTVVVTDGVLKIGIKTIGVLTGSWNGADFFHLTYLGTSELEVANNELTALITAANGLLTGAETQPLFTKAAATKLSAAVATAAAVDKTSLEAVNAQIVAMKAALAAAQTTLGLTAKIMPLFIEANELLVSTDNYPESARTTLKAVIDKDMALYVADGTTDQDIIAGTAELVAAIEAYKAMKDVIPDGVENVDADAVKVYVDGSRIVVEGADYEIYSEGGLRVTGNTEFIPGVYIVKAVGQTVKVQVK